MTLKLLSHFVSSSGIQSPPGLSSTQGAAESMIYAVLLAKNQTASLSNKDLTTIGSNSHSSKADALKPRPTVFLYTRVKTVSLSCYLISDSKCFSKVLFCTASKSKEVQ